MISNGDGARRELFLRSGLGAADVVHVHREALLVLRDSIETAHVDAYSDEVWPQEVVPACERALLMAESALADGLRSATSDPGMGIDVDVHDDAQFDVLLALVPYAEATGCRRCPSTGSRCGVRPEPTDGGSTSWPPATTPTGWSSRRWTSVRRPTRPRVSSPSWTRCPTCPAPS